MRNRKATTAPAAANRNTGATNPPTAVIDGYDVRLPAVSETLIWALDDDNGEALRFALQVAGRVVRCRIPTLGRWNSYVSETVKILTALGSSVDDLDIQPIEGSILLPTDWTKHVARVIARRAVADRIIEVFFQFLRPTIDGMDEKTSREWILTNATIDAPLRFLVAILSVDEMVEKKSRYALMKALRAWNGSDSMPFFVKNSDGPPPKPTGNPS